MREIRSQPPMIDLIDAKFHTRDKNVIFAWGDVIYNPRSVRLTVPLIVHERVHGDRQKKIGIREWWQKYLDSPEFRLEEEVLAHRAEMAAHLRILGDNRTNRRKVLAVMAMRLRMPLYQYELSVSESKSRLTGDSHAL